MTVPDIALVYDNAFELIKIFIYSGVRRVFVIRAFVCGILRGVEELFRVDPHVQLVIDGERNFTVELVRHGWKRGVIDHPALQMNDEQSRQRIQTRPPQRIHLRLALVRRARGGERAR